MNNSTKKTVYFVRHGETEQNTRRAHQGDSAPLSEKGIQQTEVIATRLASYPFEIIVTSPALRAKLTAQAIKAHHDAPLIESALFVEKRVPTSLEGISYFDPKVRTIELEMLAHQDDPSWHYEDEENLTDLTERARQALAFLEARPERHIAVVSHATFLKTIVAVAWSANVTPSEVRRFHIVLKHHNTGITTCIIDPNDPFFTGWRLVTWNDCTHHTT